MAVNKFEAVINSSNALRESRKRNTKKSNKITESKIRNKRTEALDMAHREASEIICASIHRKLEQVIKILTNIDAQDINNLVPGDRETLLLDLDDINNLCNQMNAGLKESKNTKPRKRNLKESK